LAHIVYLVEEYDPAKYGAFFNTAINTSLSQTIVTDGFEVQETRSMPFTLDYFANLFWSVIEKYAVSMTRYLYVPLSRQILEQTPPHLAI
jgi:hypothetical protein